MGLLSQIVLVVCVLILPACYGDGASYTLEHSFDGKAFSSAGSILPGTQLLKYVRSAWTAKEKKAFQDLLERDGFYTLRLSPSAQSNGRFFASSVRGRCLLSPSIFEELQLHVDDVYHVVSFQYLLHNATACMSLGAGEEELGNTVPELAEEVGVSVHFAVPATGVFVMDNPEQGFPKEMRVEQPGGQSRAAKEGAGEKGDSKTPAKDERTWLQKNWLFVMVGVMMVLQVMLKAAGDVPESGGRPAPPAGAAPGPAPAAGARRPPSRRG